MVQFHFFRDHRFSFHRNIARNADAKLAVKGKSMVSEEMELNHFLAENGIEALESDLGEYIIQVDHELPSHIIMPAIHKNREEISEVFQKKIAPSKKVILPKK